MTSLTPVLTPALLRSLVVSAVLLVILGIVVCLLQTAREFAAVGGPLEECYVGTHRSPDLPYVLPRVLVDAIPPCPPMHYAPARAEGSVVVLHRSMETALASHTIGMPEVRRVAA